MNSPRQNGQAAMTLTRLNLDTDEDADEHAIYTPMGRLPSVTTILRATEEDQPSSTPGAVESDQSVRQSLQPAGNGDRFP